MAGQRIGGTGLILFTHWLTVGTLTFSSLAIRDTPPTASQARLIAFMPAF